MLPSVLIEAEQLHRDRIAELMGLHFQNQKLTDKTLDDLFAEKPKVNVFGGREPSLVKSLKNDAACFLGDLHLLENSGGTGAYSETMMKDAMRRAGETIVRRIYRDVRSSFRLKAEKQADEEFPGLKEKRQRFDDAISEIRKTKSDTRRSQLAAVYVFEEERRQYENDVTFSECVSDEHFRHHLQSVSTYCYPRFNIDDAVEKARGLMSSGRMKGKNFRKPKDAT